MKKVKITVSGPVGAYYLTLFNAGGYRFKGKKNQDVDKSLPAGNYTLKYNVTGEHTTKFKVKFSGVQQPKKDLERTIPAKGYVARTREIGV